MNKICKKQFDTLSFNDLTHLSPSFMHFLTHNDSHLGGSGNTAALQRTAENQIGALPCFPFVLVHVYVKGGLGCEVGITPWKVKHQTSKQLTVFQISIIFFYIFLKNRQTKMSRSVICLLDSKNMQLYYVTFPKSIKTADSLGLKKNMMKNHHINLRKKLK